MLVWLFIVLGLRISNGKWKTLTPKLRSELGDDELEETGTPEKYYKLDNAFFPRCQFQIMEQLAALK